MSVLELLANLDWWQLGWLFAGFFMLLFVAAIAKAYGAVKTGYEAGYHDRQHWESDELLKGAIKSAFEKK